MNSDTYLTRETLLKRLKFSDDDMAWEEFSFYYKRFIYSIIDKIGVRLQDYDDLAQRVVLKVWQSLPDFDYDQKQGSFRSWLYVVTRNIAYNFVTRDKKYIYEHDQLVESSHANAVDPEVEKLIEEEWRLHISTLAFENVSKSTSEKVMDIFRASAEGESLSSISERLAMSEDTVCRYKNRVKEKLVAEIKSLRDMLE